MDVYGNALMESKREANSKVVEMVLKPAKASVRKLDSGEWESVGVNLEQQPSEINV